MPPIRSLSTAKPVKTERTHEENQERAYIAASRRSDRSLEARIESARRASEIHKKRTGRSLRVTEQDVVNEEMYEEEDEDIPSQYMRLSAHLTSSSLQFNRRLHDYIIAQSAVRDGFRSQFAPIGHQQQYAAQYAQQAAANPFMGHQMPPPVAFNQPQPMFNQHSQSFSPSTYQQPTQGYRQTPYSVSQRPQSHQRSASISTPQHMQGFQPPSQHTNSVISASQAEEQRRMSLPSQINTVSHQSVNDQPRPILSRNSTSQSVHQHPASPQHVSPTNLSPALTQGTPVSRSGNNSPMSPNYISMSQAQSQVLNLNPLTMSLPPETQQFVGSALEPNDPNTAILMAGSENIPQPFRGTYHYNPNVSPKSSRAWNTTSMSGMDPTLAPSHPLKVDTPMDSALPGEPLSALSEGHISPSSMLNPTGFGFENFYNDPYQGSEFTHFNSNQGSQEEFDASAYFNFND